MTQSKPIQYVYFADEDFSFDDPWEAANRALETDDTRTHIERGVPIYPTASDFVPSNFADFLGEEASNSDYGDHADEWMDGATKDQKDTLQKRVEALVESWAQECDLQPKFYTVSSVESFPIPEEQRQQFLVEYAAQTVFAQEGL